MDFFLCIVVYINLDRLDNNVFSFVFVTDAIYHVCVCSVCVCECRSPTNTDWIALSYSQSPVKIPPIYKSG